VVGGLKAQPLILGLVVLNAIGIGAAAWFLHDLAAAQTARYNQIFELVRMICSRS
jgi:type IV secretory pathway TrbD component